MKDSPKQYKSEIRSRANGRVAPMSRRYLVEGAPGPSPLGTGEEFQL